MRLLREEHGGGTRRSETFEEKKRERSEVKDLGDRLMRLDACIL